MTAPFLVARSEMDRDKWVLWMRTPLLHKGYFDTQADAIDHAYRNWPWYL
jgi:hypothetical protein